MPEQTRSFIAVRFSEEFIAVLAGAAARFKRALGAPAGIRWVEPRNIHLTIQFLGEVEAAELARLSAALFGAFSDLPPFGVSLAGLGAFPSPRRPRVLWAGIASGAGEIGRLAGRVLSVTASLGFPGEQRPFSPHVTLGRIRDPRKTADISGAIDKIGRLEAGVCQIDMVHLVASELRPKGPVYTTLDSFPLGH